MVSLYLSALHLTPVHTCYFTVPSAFQLYVVRHFSAVQPAIRHAEATASLGDIFLIGFGE